MDPRFRITQRDQASLPVLTQRQARGGCLVLFGAGGDLARRKLFPALYELERDGLLPTDLAVVGTARTRRDRQAFADQVRASIEEHGRSGLGDPDALARLIGRLDYVPLDFDAPQGYARLGQAIAAATQRFQDRGDRIFYLATPPSIVPDLLEGLHGAGLLARRDPAAAGQRWDKVIFEKPFGRDLNSAIELNRQAARYLDESQIFRIDHYLGKETVQNIMVFRFANAIFEPLWNRKYVSHVEISAAESIGVAGRGAFYDEAGALRDILQNHLLQVLALTAMEAPVGFEADPVRDEKVKVFRSLRPLASEDLVRAQYRGYDLEPGVAADSRTETYVALRAFVDNWRWRDVPFYLRVGKHLAAKRTEVAVFFQRVPHCLFGDQRQCALLPDNVITLRIQPDEGISLRFASKVPAPELTVGAFDMDFRYAGSGAQPPREAYERLLHNVLLGDATLFARRDGVEESWRYVQPALDAWAAHPEDEIPAYEPGGQGPTQAEALPALDGHRWTRLD